MASDAPTQTTFSVGPSGTQAVAVMSSSTYTIEVCILINVNHLLAVVLLAFLIWVYLV